MAIAVTNSGNVGIGTTNPSTLLDIDPGSSYASNPAIKVVSSYPDGYNAMLELSNTYSGGHDWEIRAGNNASGGIGADLQIYDATSSVSRLDISTAGNVGIGTIDPTYPLSVNGTIQAKEVIVQSGWSDYVFSKSYKLVPLSSVERTIESEHHLPGIPSAKEVAAKGVNLGQMDSAILVQVEELTLRVIDQEKRIERLEAQNARLRGTADPR